MMSQDAMMCVRRRRRPATWIAVAAKLGRHRARRLTPRQFMLTIAKRGGYLDRKHDPQAGWKVL